MNWKEQGHVSSIICAPLFGRSVFWGNLLFAKRTCLTRADVVSPQIGTFERTHPDINVATNESPRRKQRGILMD